jgi:hypothetical protein
MNQNWQLRIVKTQPVPDELKSFIPAYEWRDIILDEKMFQIVVHPVRTKNFFSDGEFNMVAMETEHLENLRQKIQNTSNPIFVEYLE